MLSLRKRKKDNLHQEQPQFFIYLKYACLCINCDAIFHIYLNKQCPICQSNNFISLAKILNRRGG